MVAEYANRYKHLPPDDIPWHLFLALLTRAQRFETRDRLVIQDGMLYAQSGSKGDEATRMLMDAKLRDVAALGEKV